MNHQHAETLLKEARDFAAQGYAHSMVTSRIDAAIAALSGGGELLDPSRQRQALSIGHEVIIHDPAAPVTDGGERTLNLRGVLSEALAFVIAHADKDEDPEKWTLTRELRAELAALPAPGDAVRELPDTFPDKSDASPLVKAERVLNDIVSWGPSTYFFRNGFPRPELRAAAKATLDVLLALAALLVVRDEGDVFVAYRTWPADIRAKLSAHDLRRMSGWSPRVVVGDWRIDTSAGGPILVYQDCSVIESEQAAYVLALIVADAERRAAPPVAQERGQAESELVARLKVAGRALFRERVTYWEDLETIADVIEHLERLAAAAAEGKANG